MNFKLLGSDTPGVYLTGSTYNTSPPTLNFTSVASQIGTDGFNSLSGPAASFLTTTQICVATYSTTSNSTYPAPASKRAADGLWRRPIRQVSSASDHFCAASNWG